MIDALKFVKGAVAKKDIIPGMTHFRVHQGTIKAHNGIITISSPIDLGIDCQPKAVDFVKAIEQCDGAVAMAMTPAGRLSVRSGKFKAFINCGVDGTFPDVEPEGEVHPLPEGGLMKALKVLETMIAEDASRPWARGILFRGEFAHATNNVVICQYWLGYEFPFDLVIPHLAVNELMRIGIEPISVQFTENSVTFHYPDGQWFRTQTNPTTWPNIAMVLDKENIEAQDLPPTFFKDLELLRPFVDDLNHLYFVQGAMATHIDEGLGARVEHDGDFAHVFPTEACYNINMMRMLSSVATSMDFNQVPALFFGENLRGAIMHMKHQ